MTDHEAFSELMARLRAGDDAAAAGVFHRYHRRLLGLARARLGTGVQRRVDPDDIVQSVYRSFFRRYGDGQFEVGDWDGLWALLTLITVRKCAGRVQYLLAACRSVRREADDPDEGPEPAGADPTPEEAAVLAETLEQVLRGMDRWEAEVLTLSLQGYSVEEIGRQVGRAERTVERVRERIKNRLRRLQLADGDGAA